MSFPEWSFYGEQLPEYLGEPSTELEKRIMTLARYNSLLYRVLELAYYNQMSYADRMTLLAYVFIQQHQQAMQRLHDEITMRPSAPLVGPDGEVYVWDPNHVLQQRLQESHTPAQSSPGAQDGSGIQPGTSAAPTTA